MATPGKKRSAASNRGSAELQRIIREQGVKPVTDLNEVASLWPADDDPDALLAFLKQERAARRDVVPRRKIA